MHMSLLGPEGLERCCGTRNMSACVLAKQKLSEIDGVHTLFTTSHFNEFVVELPKVLLTV